LQANVQRERKVYKKEKFNVYAMPILAYISLEDRELSQFLQSLLAAQRDGFAKFLVHQLGHYKNIYNKIIK
jgi:hypothetical protein